MQKPANASVPYFFFISKNFVATKSNASSQVALSNSPVSLFLIKGYFILSPE